VILISFGTCELTAKKGKYIYLRQPPYQNVEVCLTEARELKRKLLRANRDAKIYFLECPYYSTIKFNKQEISINKSVSDLNNNSKTKNRTVLKAKRGSGLTNTSTNRKQNNISVNDIKLNKAVEYYNSQLILLNGIVTPTLSKVILVPTKRAIYSRTK